MRGDAVRSRNTGTSLSRTSANSPLHSISMRKVGKGVRYLFARRARRARRAKRYLTPFSSRQDRDREPLRRAEAERRQRAARRPRPDRLQVERHSDERRIVREREPRGAVPRRVAEEVEPVEERRAED